jgi:DNA primase
MGTALTQEQLAELGRSAPLVVLALDADRSGMEAMLRAARAAQDRRLELRVVEMPEGRDPAEIVTHDGDEAFERQLDSAMGIIQFQIRRALADADLENPAGRDRALDEVRKLIAAVPERTATRDALVRDVADRLDVPAEYVNVAPARSPGPAAAGATMPRFGVSPGEASLAAERAFLSMCLASGQLGREFFGRLTDDHLSSATTRSARAHLAAGFDDPLAGLPEDDAAAAALITGVAMAAQEQAEAPEPVLRMSFLQLELRRIEREIRRAAAEANHVRQDELAGARQDVRREMDTVMGQTA